MPAAKSSPAVSTRDRILRAGISRFQAHGYHGTGVAAILQDACAPKGCFYHHFPGGKEQLAVVAVGWLASEVDGFLDSLAGLGATAPAMAIGMAEYAAKGLARPDPNRGSLITVLAGEAVPDSALIDAAVKRAIAGWVARLSRAYERAGELHPDVRARAALALVEGATVMARISGRPQDAIDLVASSLSGADVDATAQTAAVL